MTSDRIGQPYGWDIDDVKVDSPVLGEPWRVLVQRPVDPATRLPWLWLLHGSTSTADEMRPVLQAAAWAMDDGVAAPMIIAAPDAPDGYRSHWWVDSSYTPPDDEPEEPGDRAPRRGRPLEGSLLGDVLPEVEARYGDPPRPADRAIGGISMGGAAALRWLLVRPDLFGSSLLLSPAVYEPTPADESSARVTGAFGIGRTLFDERRFRELMDYAALLAVRQPADSPTRVVIIAGDGEPAQWSDGRRCDLDLEAVRLHAALKVRPDFRPALRVVAGGHDWPLWEREIGPGLALLST